MDRSPRRNATPRLWSAARWRSARSKRNTASCWSTWLRLGSASAPRLEKIQIELSKGHVCFSGFPSASRVGAVPRCNFDAFSVQKNPHSQVRQCFLGDQRRQRAGRLGGSAQNRAACSFLGDQHPLPRRRASLRWTEYCGSRNGCRAATHLGSRSPDRRIQASGHAFSCSGQWRFAVHRPGIPACPRPMILHEPSSARSYPP